MSPALLAAIATIVPTVSTPARAPASTQPAAAKIVDDLLGEYADLFPGPYWHLGGDEYQALTVRDPAASDPAAPVVRMSSKIVVLAP